MAEYRMVCLGLDAESNMKWNVTKDGEVVMTSVDYTEARATVMAVIKIGDRYQEEDGRGVVQHDIIICPRDRLEYLREELQAERVSYDNLHELESLAQHIEPGDVELLEPAGVPEFPPDNCLAGMKCPKCGQYKSFHITGHDDTGIITAELFDDGTDQVTGDFEFDDPDKARCTHCDWSGTVGQLRPV